MGRPRGETLPKTVTLMTTIEWRKIFNPPDWLKPGGKGAPEPLDGPPRGQKRPDEPPPAGPRPGGGRRPVPEGPLPGSPDDVGARLAAVQAAEDALEAEQAAQTKRLAALAACEKESAKKDTDILDDLQDDVDKLKKEFEQLQDDLRKEVGKQLTAIDDFANKYNDRWASVMDQLDDYFSNLHALKDPLAELWKAHGDMDWAMKIAGIGDEGLMIAQILLPELLAMKAAAGEQALGKLGAKISELEGAAARSAGKEVIAGEKAGARAAAERAAVERAAAREEAMAGRAATESGGAEAGVAEQEATGASKVEPGGKSKLEVDELLPEAHEAARAPKVEPATVKQLEDEAAAAREAAGARIRDLKARGIDVDKVQVYTMDEANAIKRANDARFANTHPNSLGRSTFFGSDADILANTSHIPPKSGYYDVFIHGSPGRMEIQGEKLYGVVMDKKVVSPEQLFEMIKKDGYTGGPIRLFSCETGQVVPLKGYGPSVEPVASKLAQLTKNEVIAPIDTVKVARDGGLGWKNPEYVRDQPGPGWQTFKP